MVWISWALVVAGVALVIAAVMSVSGRLRPLRRALRRLSWRAEDLARLQARAETLTARVAELTEEAEALRAARSERMAPVRPGEEGAGPNSLPARG